MSSTDKKNLYHNFALNSAKAKRVKAVELIAKLEQDIAYLEAVIGLEPAKKPKKKKKVKAELVDADPTTTEAVAS